MAKFKFRSNENTTIDDAEKALYNLKKLSGNEIPLNEVLKILRFLGVEELKGRKSGTGSVVRFRHHLLVGYQHFYQGYFKVDLIHGGKSMKKIRKKNFVNYLFPTTLEIIRRIREEGETK